MANVRSVSATVLLVWLSVRLSVGVVDTADAMLVWGGARLVVGEVISADAMLAPLSGVCKENILYESVVIAVSEALSRNSTRVASIFRLFARALITTTATTNVSVKPAITVTISAVFAANGEVVMAAVVSIALVTFGVRFGAVVVVVRLATVAVVVLVEMAVVVLLALVEAVLVVVAVTVLVEIGKVVVLAVAPHTIDDIDPGDPVNILVFIAFEFTQKAPQSVWRKETAERNISRKSITADIAHADRFWLKDRAQENIWCMLVTADTSHPDRSWLNDDA